MPLMFSYANDQLNQSLEHALTLGMKFPVSSRMSGISNDSSRKLQVLRIFCKNFICLFMIITLIMISYATEIYI